MTESRREVRRGFGIKSCEAGLKKEITKACCRSRQRTPLNLLRFILFLSQYDVRLCVCVCVGRERKREKIQNGCVLERERERMCMCEREGVWETEGLGMSERERVCGSEIRAYFRFISFKNDCQKQFDTVFHPTKLNFLPCPFWILLKLLPRWFPNKYQEIFIV